MNWKDPDTIPPENNEHCLTSTKYGLLEGQYDAAYDHFTGYVCGQDLCWAAQEWMPLNEAYALLGGER